MAKYYDIVLSGMARSRLIELAAGPCELLKQAIWSTLPEEGGAVIKFAHVKVRCIETYWVVFRDLDDVERQRFDTRSGHYILYIEDTLEKVLRVLTRA